MTRRTLPLLLALVALVAALAPAAQARAKPASGAWALMHLRAPQRTASLAQGSLSSVACPADGECIAVGSSGPSGQSSPLAEIWNGSDWSQQSTPPEGSGAVSTAISCPSAQWCMAIGESGALFAQTWNGQSWSSVTIPAPSGTTADDYPILAGISCPSADFCLAVGSNDSASDPTLVYTWNGSSWTQSTAPASLGIASGVFCLDATSCLAVGASGGTDPTAATWDNGTWTAASTGLSFPTSDFNATLQSVSCSAANACEAVGYYATGAGDNAPDVPFLAAWNGSAWTTTTQQPALGEGGITSVACTSTGCRAAGDNDDTSTAYTLDISGSGFSVDPGANVTTYGVPGLAGIACMPDGDCVEVGGYESQAPDAAGVAEPFALVQTAAGWSVANPAPTQGELRVTADADLTAVSCSAPTRCMATGADDGPLAERLTGSSWTSLALAPTGAPAGSGPQSRTLTGVSCPSPNDCELVGNDDSGPKPVPFAQRWSPAGFANQASFAAASGSTIDAISCSAAAKCLAVGGGPDLAAVALDGATWTTTAFATAPAPTGSEMLRGVACLAGLSCLSVGDDTEASDTVFTPVADRYTNATWSSLALTGAQAMKSISCSSRTACMAVAASERGILRFNGRRWRFLSSEQAVLISAVTCPSATVCYVAGINEQDTLAIWRWTASTGFVAQTVPSPAGAAYAEVDAMSCPSPTSCIAVGEYMSKQTQLLPLVLRLWQGRS